MTALSPAALAWSQDRTIVRYPDPAVETLDALAAAATTGYAMMFSL